MLKAPQKRFFQGSVCSAGRGCDTYVQTRVYDDEGVALHTALASGSTYLTKYVAASDDSMKATFFGNFDGHMHGNVPSNYGNGFCRPLSASRAVSMCEASLSGKTFGTGSGTEFPCKAVFSDKDQIMRCDVRSNTDTNGEEVPTQCTLVTSAASTKGKHHGAFTTCGGILESFSVDRMQE